jgi:hypothetical protein
MEMRIRWNPKMQEDSNFLNTSSSSSFKGTLKCTHIFGGRQPTWMEMGTR